MTDPTPQTTPTRDEAVPADERRIDLPNGYYLFQIRPSDMTCSLHMPDGLHIGNLLTQYAGADFASAMFASAPAPASGRVDAVKEVVAEELALKIVSLSVNWLREDGTDREHEDYVRANWTKEIAEAKRLILAALSPAAPPVSEAGPAAPFSLRSHMAYIAAYDPDELTGGDSAEGQRAAQRLRSIIERARSALAKPASSPAGGDVREALKAIAEGYTVSVYDDRYISVDNPAYRPDDGSPPKLVIDTAALSQSTSAGRVGE